MSAVPSSTSNRPTGRWPNTSNRKPVAVSVKDTEFMRRGADQLPRPDSVRVNEFS
jgi:hypothetical protein